MRPLVERAHRLLAPAAYHLLPRRARLLPDFLIIGAQRSGTTSLYSRLVEHPEVTRAVVKEVHFFDLNHRRGIEWYRSFFPTAVRRFWMTRVRGRGFVTGEATPYYLFHPHAPGRVARVLPHVRLIAILRNPVARAYSHYCYERSRGRETLCFEDAIACEPERLAPEIERLSNDEDYYSFAHHHFSYLARGIYVDQLLRWARLFPQSQILVLKAEDLFSRPDEVLEETWAFLGLPAARLPELEVYNASSYPPMRASTRGRLAEFFAPHNARLFAYLARDFGWGT